MKAREGYIEITSYEIDDLTAYPMGKKLDRHFAGVLGDEIELYQDDIARFLDLAAYDWEQVPLEYTAEDNVPKQSSDFEKFISRGKRLKAREASLILRYAGEEAETERQSLAHRIPTDFAREIAVLSMMHSIVEKSRADGYRIADRSVHDEVMAMPDREAARQAWIQSHRINHRNIITKAYWNELKRKEHMETAKEYSDNVDELAQAYSFTIADAMHGYFTKNNKRK